MRKSIFDIQKEILLVCSENGTYTPNRKRYSKHNEALRLAISAGLMKKSGGNFVLTDGGKSKIKELE